MFASSLPLLPPPATSLLPSLHDRPSFDTSSTAATQNSLQAQQQQQQQQRRIRGHPHAIHPRSDLAILARDERILTQRKLAIAMYGYAWLKPAGCAKTMLGRREEEIEREEVERQLREVELQEHNAAEAEDAERQTQLSQQRAREAQGEDVGAPGERDLDEDVPDMDEEDVDEFEDEGSDENDEDDDLDNSVPEVDSNWRYDTTRDPDTESEDEAQHRPRLQQRQSQSQAPTQNVQSRLSLDGHEVPINSTLYEDELGEYGEEHDLDDEIPDHEGQFRNLDDDVPEAGSEDGEWEHTDTELEESEMDISIMPPGVTAHHNHLHPHTSHSLQTNQRNLYPGASSQQSEIGTGLRRTSGNIPSSSLPSSNPLTNPQTGARGLARPQNQIQNFTPNQFGSDFSVSALISTGHTNASPAVQQPGNSFSESTGPRRNLFGTTRAAPSQGNNITRAISGRQTSGLSFEAPQGSFTTTASQQVSSGGLFTPSPQQQQLNVQRIQSNAEEINASVRTTRSGRRLLDRVIPARRQGQA